MQCPNCKSELKLEGDFYSSQVDIDVTDVTGEVVITFICAECSGELGEYPFELELDIADFAAEHEDEEEHELSVEVSDESFDKHTDDKGAIYPGASAAIRVSCICGKFVDYLWRDYETMEEISKEFEL